MSIEIWKAVPGYEERYMASTYGRIYSKKYKRIIKEYKTKDGYSAFSVYSKSNGIEKKNGTKTHSLIAKTFIPNPNNLPQVNHINEIKTDNRIENLEWVTAKQNANHGTRNKRMGLNGRKWINQLDLNGNFIKKYHGGVELEKIGYGFGNICNVCRGKLNTAYGFKWEYAQ